MVTTEDLTGAPPPLEREGTRRLVLPSPCVRLDVATRNLLMRSVYESDERPPLSSNQGVCGEFQLGRHGRVERRRYGRLCAVPLGSSANKPPFSKNIRA